jgi:hypothetical protein
MSGGICAAANGEQTTTSATIHNFGRMVTSIAVGNRVGQGRVCVRLTISSCSRWRRRVNS